MEENMGKRMQENRWRIYSEEMRKWDGKGEWENTYSSKTPHGTAQLISIFGGITVHAIINQKKYCIMNMLFFFQG
jgi:hypothetical protein